MGIPQRPTIPQLRLQTNRLPPQSPHTCHAMRETGSTEPLLRPRTACPLLQESESPVPCLPGPTMDIQGSLRYGIEVRDMAEEDVRNCAQRDCRDGLHELTRILPLVAGAMVSWS